MVPIRRVICRRRADQSHAVKCNVYLTDMDDFEMNAEYAEFFTAPYPARTTVSCGAAAGRPRGKSR